MTTLHVREYHELARDVSGYKMPVGKEPALASQTVTYTTTSTQSTAFQSSTTTSANTHLIRVVATGDTLIEFGENPTAVATSILIKAGAAEYFGVTPGHKIAAKDA